MPVNHYFTNYEVTIDVFKNGQFYDTATLPINSLIAVPADVGAAFGFTLATSPSWAPYVVPSLINQTTVSGGMQYGSLWGQDAVPTQYSAIAGTSWSEFFTHTVDIPDGNTGDTH